MTTFYLVRHAHANWVPSENRPLSDKGVQKTERVADILQSLPITHIYSSPYRRAAQTVEPLAQRLDLPLIIYPDLRERQLAGSPVDDFEEANERVWHDPTFAHPGGESNVVAQERGVQAIARLRQQHPREHIAVASHGTLLALILQHFNPELGYEFWRAMAMPDIYRLSFPTGKDVDITRLWQD